MGAGLRPIAESGGYATGPYSWRASRRLYDMMKSDAVKVCAGQRPDQVGSSPTGARVRGAISKGGGNASSAGMSRYAIV